jgi:nucleotide-binding universal stress UspA family protein
VIAIHPLGALIAAAIVASIGATLYWMLHPPKAQADIAAQAAEAALGEMVGSVIVVFSQEIHSEHVMVLAARLARREHAELLALYIVEIPMILAQGAAMPEEDRRGYDALATAEVIAQHHGVALRSELIHARLTGPAVLEIAAREKASLIVMGSFREGRYSGAPFGRAIDAIASGAQCDVLIGVPGPHGRTLGQ